MKCRDVGLAAALSVVSVYESAAAAEKPRMLNPFAGSPAAIEEGRKLYQANGCAACHGVQGGGGMGKAILDDTWAFGSDDEALFKLMKGQIPQQTMPKTWASLPDDQIWKMIAYVRTLYKGDPGLINWAVTKPSGKNP
jgi:mono/diheme cytochrome c family protein